MLSVLSLCLLVTSVVAKTTPYARCQAPQPQGKQLDGCPRGTLFVSQTDPQSQFGTINAALATLPDDECVELHLGAHFAT